MEHYVFNLRDVDRTQVARVGGKGANLGELSRIPGIRVPGGFCVSTEAFARALAGIPAMPEQLDRLAAAAGPDEIRARSAEIRRLIGSGAVPTDLREEVAGALDPARAMPSARAPRPRICRPRPLRAGSAFLPYREYPKYHIVSRYFVYKQALLREADALVQAGLIRVREDIYYLTFPEPHEAVRTQRIDRALLGRRREEQRAFGQLFPPRVLTSDGEALAGEYARGDVPAGALVGLAVSSGVVERRARVVLDLGAADLGEGDIPVTTFTVRAGPRCSSRSGGW